MASLATGLILGLSGVGVGGGGWVGSGWEGWGRNVKGSSLATPGRFWVSPVKLNVRSWSKRSCLANISWCLLRARHCCRLKGTTANSSKQRSSYSSWADSCTEGRRASQSCRKHIKVISEVPVSLPELPHSLTSAGARILHK